LGFNLYGERFSGEMNNINIVFDELRQNEIDIDARRGIKNLILYEIT
jgi:hypothetical protein